jgi:hypothetical protein
MTSKYLPPVYPDLTYRTFEKNGRYYYEFFSKGLKIGEFDHSTNTGPCNPESAYGAWQLKTAVQAMVKAKKEGRL